MNPADRAFVDALRAEVRRVAAGADTDGVRYALLVDEGDGARVCSRLLALLDAAEQRIEGSDERCASYQRELAGCEEELAAAEAEVTRLTEAAIRSEAELNTAERFVTEAQNTRRALATLLGCEAPDTATWQDVVDQAMGVVAEGGAWQLRCATHEERQRCFAVRIGLPETATREQIEDAADRGLLEALAWKRRWRSGQRHIELLQGLLHGADLELASRSVGKLRWLRERARMARVIARLWKARGRAFRAEARLRQLVSAVAEALHLLHTCDGCGRLATRERWIEREGFGMERVCDNPACEDKRNPVDLWEMTHADLHRSLQAALDAGRAR